MMIYGFWVTISLPAHTDKATNLVNKEENNYFVDEYFNVTAYCNSKYASAEQNIIIPLSINKQKNA